MRKWMLLHVGKLWPQIPDGQCHIAIKHQLRDLISTNKILTILPPSSNVYEDFPLHRRSLCSLTFSFHSKQ